MRVVSEGLVSQWECGERHPHGASLKLLTLVARKGIAGGSVNWRPRHLRRSESAERPAWRSQ